MTHSIISLGQRTVSSALLHRANCQPDTLPTPPIKENLGVLLRTCVRSRRFSLYARTQRKTENAPYRGIKSGSCPPAIGGEVRLHKGFDAHKAWFSCPLPAAFSGSPTWGSSPGIPCRRSCGFQGSTGKTATKKPSQNRPALPSLFLEGHASRLCNG